MKRCEKFPSTDTFEYFNANPKNKATDDCVVRAIARAANMSYTDVMDKLVNIWKKTGYMPTDSRNYFKLLTELGFVRNKQPRKRDNTKYTGKEFCEYLRNVRNKKNVVAHIGGHHIVAIVDNKVNDIWDSTNGSIGVYWTKGTLRRDLLD